MIYFKGKQYMEPSMFSSERIKNEVLTITSEHPSSEDNFESKSRANISPFDQIYYQPEEELIEFKEK